MGHIHKTYKYRLAPTLAQETMLEEVLWRCRTLDNCMLEQRITRWRRGQGVSVLRYEQEAEWKELHAAFPTSREQTARTHSPI